jgi:protein-tyrosine-phosphatase
MTSKLRILFVCGGNSCRSPMAAGLASKLFGVRVHAESAGMDPEDAVSDDAIRAMAEQGVDISAHRPRDVEEVALSDFDYIVAMRPYIARDLTGQWGAEKQKLITWDIDDPYRRGLAAYRDCAAVLRAHVMDLGSRLRLTED